MGAEADCAAYRGLLLILTPPLHLPGIRARTGAQGHGTASTPPPRFSTCLSSSSSSKPIARPTARSAPLAAASSRIRVYIYIRVQRNVLASLKCTLENL